MNKTRSTVLLIIFAFITYKFWDFDIKWYWVILLSYIITSILFGIFALSENAKEPPLQTSIFWVGFAWPIYVIGGFANIKSDHNRTIDDH
ncbi:hypothetical protein [Winogradskyella sp. 3972H.M.0a.05]|uniref:hypothetical protein n=1 Tax=Winogradskyella sp. 3972H.M.0a.05 TaxID=2950277 RepID=UPI003398FE08